MNAKIVCEKRRERAKSKARARSARSIRCRVCEDAPQRATQLLGRATAFHTRSKRRQPSVLLHLAFLSLTCAFVVTTHGEAWGDQAEDLLHEGVMKHNTLQLDESIRVLTQARAATRNGKLLGQIYLYLGLDYIVLGKESAARQAFARALTHDPSVSIDPGRFKAATFSLFQSVRETMRGELIVTADCPDALVFVDGKPRGKVSWQDQLPIGTHHVEVRDPERQGKFSTVIQIATGKKTSVHAQLAMKLGKLTVQSSPSGAKIFLDGRALGRTPLTKTTVAAGEHRLLLRLSGYLQHERRLKILSMQTANVRVHLETSITPPRPRLWTWVVGGSAALLALVAVGIGASIKANQSEYEKASEERQNELEPMIQDKARVTNVLFGAAGSLAATAAVLFFFEGRTERTSLKKIHSLTHTTQVLPLVGSTMGALLETSF